MAKINLVSAVIGVAAGGIDEFLEQKDATAGRVDETKKWSTWFRAGATVLGYLGQGMGWMPEYAAPLAQSSVTLLTKTAYKMVLPATATTAARTSRVVAHYGGIAQTTKPQFENQRSY